MMMPEAKIANTTMKSIRAARVSSIQHNASHKSSMHTKRMMLLVVIASVVICLTCKSNQYL